MAKLLDRPFTSGEKRQILDMLQGNINRISVSNDIEEIVCQLNFAVDRLSAVAYSRIKELTEKGKLTMTGTETLLMDYIMRHTYSCPIKDDAGIDFTNECVGFKEPGCRECIMKHLEELR